MTNDQRAKLEQVAREFVAQLERDSSLLDDLKEARWRSVCLPDLLERLVDLLAAQRAAVRAEECWKLHVPVTSEQHDPTKGLLHGYCERCRTPWPCEYSPESKT